jgi:hypothetical protein
VEEQQSAVATVSEAGLISAVKAGSATITASVGGVNTALPVTVAAGSLASLTLSPDNVDARTGDVIRFASPQRMPPERSSPVSRRRGALPQDRVPSKVTARSLATKLANTRSPHRSARAV